MKLLLTPGFTEKLASLQKEDLAAIYSIVQLVQETEKSKLESGADGIEFRQLSDDIWSMRVGNSRVYGSFASDDDGEYCLLLDISIEANRSTTPSNFFAAKDPRKNSSLNPNTNMTIDPRRNMTIDPRRNMTIDPNRNMTIDPRRNMTIDPRRNMTIDPNRNMTIDPRRNMMIDPNRNMMIDPRRNISYGGPFVYDQQLIQEGFVVRANDKVSLIFDSRAAKFSCFVVSHIANGANIFDPTGQWIGFLVSANNDVSLRFDTSGNWTGLIV
ncbi:MAG: hypothetical protein IPJ12_07395 [Betaproteobacteria bacterium]|nr:hypothetical protein [Betaproteobacteria bacterium]